MEQQDGPSDAELVRRALGATSAEERTAAFTGIADRYRLTVFRQCARWFPHPEEAQDVSMATFEAAFTLLADGIGPSRPDKLAGWLIEIARRRGQEYRRKNRPLAASWEILPEGPRLDEVEDDEERFSGNARRRIYASRLVEQIGRIETGLREERHSGDAINQNYFNRLFEIARRFAEEYRREDMLADAPWEALSEGQSID